MKMMNRKNQYHSVRISGDMFFTILTVVVLTGVFVGSLFYREISAMDFVETFSVADYFFNAENELYFWNGFFYSVIKNTVLLLLVFISGVCVIGQPMCIVVLLYKGITAGLTLAMIYSNGNIKIFLVSLLIIIPNVVVSTFVLILASREGIRYSNKLFRLVFMNRTEEGFDKNIRLYLLKFGILFVIITLLSLVESTLMILVGGQNCYSIFGV